MFTNLIQNEELEGFSKNLNDLKAFKGSFHYKFKNFVLSLKHSHTQNNFFFRLSRIARANFSRQMKIEALAGFVFFKMFSFFLDCVL